MSYINDKGQIVFVGQEAVEALLLGCRRLLENRKLHYKTTFQDIPVSVENRKGSVRRGTDPDGDEWKTKMRLPYGYIPGTEGADGDELDVFVGPEEDSAFAYIVHTNNIETGEFDEDKVMLGFSSEEQAKKCFLQHYDDPKFFGGIEAIPMWKFRMKAFVKKETTKKLVASKREGASLQVPEDFFESISDEGGRDTDQIMKKSILGRNLMPSPGVREAKKRKVKEHGVKGMKWGGSRLEQKIDSLTKTFQLVKDPAAKKVLARRLENIRDEIKSRESLNLRISAFGRRLREGRTYYARPLNRYGTESEDNDVDLIKESFGGSVDFPKTRRHSDLGMGHFHEKVDKADRLVVRPNRKNRLTAGTFSEARHAIKEGIPVFAIRKGKLRKVSSVEALDGANNKGHFGKVIFRKRKK